MDDTQIDSALERIFFEVLHLSESADPRSISRQSFEAWDSFAHLEILIRIEEQFGIELSDSSGTHSNFGEIRDTVRYLINENHE